ncbi:MAG: SDR family oxidoreductase [Sphaerotilus natans subsp. sulfidivorans]|uniref:SDR family oxidoreductase n=1 Tax=Sphaerotilus sulfidivorans TaxID=639200 RepID=UPI00235789DF|nr:SDR family oxidoreductase [Sphaerotilus sulfidivorans]MCK6401339.1 SDR family oxidoreductase [Sphaerotilus sulfidivorans]
MSTVQQRSVLVTGVSSGIGQAVAQGLLERGWHVFGSVRRTADGDALVTRWGQGFEPLVFDVTDAAGIETAVHALQQRLANGRLDALVNNAGISHSGPLLHQPLDELRAMFEVNVFGLLQVVRAFAPLLGARRGAAGVPGRIVNIGSVSGAITVPFLGGYSASKHAVEAIGQALRRELSPYGVAVTTIEPGFIRSRMFEKSVQSESRYGDTDYATIWKRFNVSLRQRESAAQDPEVVVRAVVEALDAKRPRTRHPLDPLWRIGHLLPDRGFDRLIFKSLGIAELMHPPRSSS